MWVWYPRGEGMKIKTTKISSKAVAHPKPLLPLAGNIRGRKLSRIGRKLVFSWRKLLRKQRKYDITSMYIFYLRQPHYVQDKVFVGVEQAPDSFKMVP
jgi:hypothetical protein